MLKRLKKQVKKSVVSRKPAPQVSADLIKKTKIRVIGIGGGGGTIVSEIASRMPKASSVVINTDTQALRACGKKVTRVQIGQALTHGLGTGMNPELGREAAEAEKEKIEKLLQGQDLCILVACLGGGTGSGALPVIAKISKSLGNITYGIFTFPFAFEGEKKMEIAKDSLDSAKNYVNALSLIPNERAFQIIDKSTPLKEALSIVNKNLTNSLSGLIETIYKPGLINIDFADFKTILESKGRLAFLNTVEVRREEESTKDLVSQVLTSPLYPYTIKGAKGVLFNIAGERKLSLSEVNEISKAISGLVNPAAKIIFGISQTSDQKNSIKTTLLATGCSMKIFPSKPRKAVRKKVKKVAAKEPVPVPEPEPVEEKPTPVQKRVVKRRPRPKPKPVEKPEPKKVKPKKKIKKVVKKAVIVKIAKAPVKEEVRKNALQIRKEAQEVENEMLEQEKFWETPAFLRRKPQ